MGLTPGLVQWIKGSSVAVSCGVGCRLGSDPALLWRWRRPETPALIGPLAWEPQYAENGAKKKKKNKKKKKKATHTEIVWGV